MLIHKTFDITVKEKRKDGGRILISTGSLDRERDRVLPQGARVENYLKNPVVQWGHNYRDPWATVGKTTQLEIGEEGIIADFELRPAANDQDPQNVVLLLWNGEWIRTASIGFDPSVKAWEENEEGGRDFTAWELLEWSLVPIPANQEALRLAVKVMGEGEGSGGAEGPGIRETEEPVVHRYVLDGATSATSTWRELEGEGDGSDYEIVGKPYPNEHACRLRDPGDFQEGSFRRAPREHEGKEYFVIMGRLKGETTMTEQAYRYPKDTWSVSQARAHCKSHDGQQFEPASEGAASGDDRCACCGAVLDGAVEIKAGGQATDVEAEKPDDIQADDAADSGNINDLIPTGDVELTPEEEVALAEAIGPFVEQIRDELGV